LNGDASTRTPPVIVPPAVGPVGVLLVQTDPRLKVNAAATGELNNGINKNIAIKHIAPILNLTFDLFFI
jgi:hypothetical protein